GAIDQREIELKFAKNQWLPRFDIEGTYGYLGIDGRDNENCRFPSPGVPAGVPCNTPPVPNGNFGDTYDNYFSDSGSLNYSVRGIVSVPLGNTTARKRLTQANLQLRRSKTDERRLEQTIILDIREAVRSLDAAYRGIGAAERGSVAAAEQLRAERIRLEHGESTPFEVLLKESDLVQSESQWITAVQAYRNALTALERQQGTILESNKVNIEEASALR
ncbi:MAG: TolC family protein, partial [Myxococcota bacterium]|nr:TolC family protein [Myxococcota bacterium]